MPSPIIVQVLSDLHAEHHDGASLPSPEQVDTEADIIILAGDIGHARHSVAYGVQMFPQAPCLVLIGGNHEHYSTAESVDEGLSHMLSSAIEVMGSGVFQGQIVVLENEIQVVEVRGVSVRIMGCTFWTDFALMGLPDIGRYVV